MFPGLLPPFVPLAARPASARRPPIAAPLPRVGFLFIGGAHQMLHMAPVAAELARRGGCAVELFVGDAADRDRLADVLRMLDADLPIAVLRAPGWLRLACRLRPRKRHKALRLLANRRMLREPDMLVTAERTSTVLARLPGPGPMIVHIPHGAGDRAGGFDRRIRLFDHVIAAGAKDRDRMVAEGLVAPERCSVSGYVKLSTMTRLRASRPAAPLFGYAPDAAARPTILYNPHFARGLGSWPAFADGVARAARELTGFNLVVAPHVRLAPSLAPRDRERLLALAAPGRVIVDLGSDRSCDMSYTAAADVYVGDVSSQVYEYLHRPGPCVFLNAVGVVDPADPSFASWRFGEVVDDPDDVAAAIARAPALHARYRAEQVAALRRAVGSPDVCAAAEAARIVHELVLARQDRRRTVPGDRASRD